MEKTRMSKTGIQPHEVSHSGSGGGHTCMFKCVCIYVCLFVKGTEEQNARSPCLPLSSSFPNILWNPAQLVSPTPCPSCTQRLYSFSSKVHTPWHSSQGPEDSFLMRLNESLIEFRGAVSLWSRLRKPFVISPLPHSKAYLCWSISYHTTIHPIPITCSLVPVLVSLHHTVRLYYSLFLCTLKCGAIKDR